MNREVLRKLAAIAFWLVVAGAFALAGEVMPGLYLMVFFGLDPILALKFPTNRPTYTDETNVFWKTFRFFQIGNFTTKAGRRARLAALICCLIPISIFAPKRSWDEVTLNGLILICTVVLVSAIWLIGVRKKLIL